MSGAPTISLAGTASYLPEKVVENDFFGDEDTPRAAMFRGAKTRHHVAQGETAAQMMMHATRKLFERLNLDPHKDIDLILTNVTVPDMPMLGSGASLARALGAAPQQILDVHNCGCVSFVFMMQMARALMTSTGARTALIGNVQNAGGRVFCHPDNRKKPQSAIPGDGCGVGLLVAGGESPIRSIVTRSFPEFADDMRAVSDDGQPWWEPRTTPLYIDFNEARMASIVARGNRLVPDVIRAACKQAEITSQDIGVLLTNQPHPIFLRNWREALQVKREQHVDTFSEHGNLFGAALPISFERALDTGKIARGTKVVFGGFSHAGDYSAAAVVDWQAGASA
jgi:3-oxoacyl-[acyl-carrier-protein] synthase-3